MSEGSTLEMFPVSIIDGGSQLRLEVSYRGGGNPPWFGTRETIRVTSAALAAVRQLPGVIRVHQGVVTRSTLRLIIDVDRGIVHPESFKTALTRAVIGAVRG